MGFNSSIACYQRLWLIYLENAVNILGMSKLVQPQFQQISAAGMTAFLGERRSTCCYENGVCPSVCERFALRQTMQDRIMVCIEVE